MIQCQKCGQSNADQSNFCRFCGVKFAHLERPPLRQQPPPQPKQQRQKGSAPGQMPRPYLWKTDELNLGEVSARKTSQIENMAIAPADRDQQATRPLAATQNQPVFPHGYRCPRCSSQVMPHRTRKISSAGWITFAVLLVVFFPLFWIGLLMKEDALVCPVCELRIN